MIINIFKGNIFGVLLQEVTTELVFDLASVLKRASYILNLPTNSLLILISNE
jgi:hypothetical protein